MEKPLRRRLLLAAAGAAAGLSGCGTLDATQRASLPRGARWTVLPLANLTETPQAGNRAAAIVDTVLRTRGVEDLRRPPSALGAESLLDLQDAQAADKALAWARSAGVRYAVTGSVFEWRYKVGVDGEPAVGLALQVLDLADGGERVVWSASGGRSGWSREALSAVAQKLVRELTATLSTAP